MTPDSPQEQTPQENAPSTPPSQPAPEPQNNIITPDASPQASPQPSTTAPTTISPTQPAPNSDTASAAASAPQPQPAPTVQSSSVAQPTVTPQLHQPVIMGGTAGSPDMPAPAPMAALPKKRRPLKWVLALIVALIVLGGGYVFAFYLPNTPANIYKEGLTNTNRAYDRLVNYTTTTQAKHYKGYQADGNFKLTSAAGSGDGSFSAQSDGTNASGKFNADILGAKFNGQYRAIMSKGQTVPDMYVNITGIKQTLDGFGLPQLGSLDGKWLVIDHTLLETGLSSAAGTSHAASTKPPTYADAKDAMVKVGQVNKKYLFTTDASTAVFKNEQYLGKSTQDGRTVAGYKVGYDKAHLKAYVSALGQALDSSSLNTWAKQASGKSISDSMRLQDTLAQIDKAKSDYTFNLYIDTKTKLIHQVHIPDTSDPVNNYLNVGLNYTGGSMYPLSIEFAGKDGASITKVGLNLTLNSATDKLTGAVNVNVSGNSATTFNLSFDLQPSNQPVAVVAPKGAKSVTQILQSLGLGGSATSL